MTSTWPLPPRIAHTPQIKEPMYWLFQLLCMSILIMHSGMEELLITTGWIWEATKLIVR